MVIKPTFLFLGSLLGKVWFCCSELFSENALPNVGVLEIDEMKEEVTGINTKREQ